MFATVNKAVAGSIGWGCYNMGIEYEVKKQDKVETLPSVVGVWITFSFVDEPNIRGTHHIVNDVITSHTKVNDFVQYAQEKYNIYKSNPEYTRYKWFTITVSVIDPNTGNVTIAWSKSCKRDEKKTIISPKKKLNSSNKNSIYNQLLAEAPFNPETWASFIPDVATPAHVTNAGALQGSFTIGNIVDDHADSTD